MSPEHWEEIRPIYESFRKLESSTIRSIFEFWSDRRPLEIKLSLMHEILVNSKRLKETMESIIRYLSERDWRGTIISIVGEYGSGKTQFGHILMRRLREEGVFSKIITISPLRDVKELLLEDLSYEGPAVLIIDEIDQLLDEFERGERRDIEYLADLIRGITEGSYGNPPRGSVIMLLSKRASDTMKRDRALGSRLMDRSREFSLSMSDDERERASKEALKKIIALWLAYFEQNDDMRYAIKRSLDKIYPFMERFASELSRTREIGGVVKGLTDLSSEIIKNLGRFEDMGKIEEGKFAEDLLKKFLLSEVRNIQLKVRIGEVTKDYIAVFSDEPLSVPGARTDAHFDVWTFDPNIGIRGDLLVARVGIEIKYGKYWMEKSDQLLKIVEKYPLLLISIAELDDDERTEIRAKMGRRFDIIDINPDLFELLHVLKEDATLWFLKKYSVLERDLKESLEILMGSSVKVKEEVSERDILSEASVNILSSILRELRKAKSSKRYDTLSNLIVRTIEDTFRKYGASTPPLSSNVILGIVKILEREGMGRISQSGKSFNIDKDCRLRIEEIEQDMERRRRIERVIFDTISKPLGATLEL
ncbi:MAG: ATP-binding protein [Candidatus Korarchaeum sp.]|nr:ATP-binding protein [Candidatus Korarchaeum sp.]